jgi:hypothetical protein
MTDPNPLPSSSPPAHLNPQPQPQSQPICSFSDRLSSALAASQARPTSILQNGGHAGQNLYTPNGNGPDIHSDASSLFTPGSAPMHSHDGGMSMHAHAHANGGTGLWTPDEHGHTHEHLEHAGESAGPWGGGGSLDSGRGWMLSSADGHRKIRGKGHA